MKGPYQRLKYDGRRVWECPRCHHRQRAEGTVTSWICRCQSNEPASNRVVMRLVEEGFQQYQPRVMPLAPREPDKSTSNAGVATVPSAPSTAAAITASGVPEGEANRAVGTETQGSSSAAGESASEPDSPDSLPTREA